jgi:hypothetical protein
MLQFQIYSLCSLDHTKVRRTKGRWREWYHVGDIREETLLMLVP